MKITNEIIKKYDDLVKYNNHGELLEEIAKDFKLDSYAELFNSINRIHDIECSLNSDVLVIRERFKNGMKSYLGFSLPNEEYKLISKYI